MIRVAELPLAETMQQAEPTFSDNVQRELVRIEKASGGILRCLCFHPKSLEHVSHVYTQEDHTASLVYVISMRNSCELTRTLYQREQTKAALLVIAEKFARSMFDWRNPGIVVQRNEQGLLSGFVPVVPDVLPGLPSTDMMSACCFASMPRMLRNEDMFHRQMDVILRMVRDPAKDVCIELVDADNNKARRIKISLTPASIRTFKESVARDAAVARHKLLALCMGTHRRLGSDSVLLNVSDDALRMVAMQTSWPLAALWAHDKPGKGTTGKR